MATSQSSRTKGARPAVGYIRMSTDKQEDSPAQQRAEIEKLAKQHGYRIVRWYEDLRISGAKTLKRTGFRKMIRDAEEVGDFEAILCWDQDRFGRFDSIEAGEWISPLRRAGVQLVTVAQGRIDWDDFAGRMLYQITQEGKHRFLVDLSRNSLRGMIQHAKEGNPLGYATPYGYDRLYFDGDGHEVRRVRRGQKFHKPRDWTAKFVPSEDPVEVETVRWLFEQYDKGRSLRSLAVELNRRGVKSPSGYEWKYYSVKSILQRPVYLGLLTYGGRGTGLYHRVGEGGDIVPATEEVDVGDRLAPIVVEGTHEAMVDRDLYDRVQARIAERSEVRGGPFRKYLLSGLLRCGHCGALLVGNCGSKGSNKGGVRYTYYKCKRSANSGTCESYGVRTEVIEQALIERFREVWLSPNGRKALRKALRKVAPTKRRRKSGQRETLRSQIADLERRIERGTENLLLADPNDVAGMSRMLGDWRRRRGDLEAELAGLADDGDGPAVDPDAVIAELDDLGDRMTGECVLEAKEAFRRVFESVTLWWKQVSPHRRELVRAAIVVREPFRLTDNTSTRRRKPTPKQRVSPR